MNKQTHTNPINLRSYRWRRGAIVSYYICQRPNGNGCPTALDTTYSSYNNIAAGLIMLCEKTGRYVALFDCFFLFIWPLHSDACYYHVLSEFLSKNSLISSHCIIQLHSIGVPSVSSKLMSIALWNAKQYSPRILHTSILPRAEIHFEKNIIF